MKPVRLRINPVGASLLAIAVCQTTSMLKVLASSRASSLPQWVSGVLRISTLAPWPSLPRLAGRSG
ncbi:hypothetical protein FHK92_13500 [Pseudomonas brassicacearum subsp. neoaurantiaca]|uniref:Uncharacterized protein n=1 Tax=Pseudomonas brassicacearum subsp. neoaurantiaca TaxID=494916 RepID=A0A7V8RLR7_9PSED|nr:hypothetical protein [Pseudomonas brassicacearum subsp. neoaurantiaca]